MYNLLKEKRTVSSGANLASQVNTNLSRFLRSILCTVADSVERPWRSWEGLSVKYIIKMYWKNRSFSQFSVLYESCWGLSLWRLGSKNPRSTILFLFLLPSLPTNEFPKSDVIVLMSVWLSGSFFINTVLKYKEENVLAFSLLPSKEVLHGPCRRVIYRVLCFLTCAFFYSKFN